MTVSETVDFSQLVLGFSSAALHYMGEVPIQGRGGLTKNLALARQNIDILIMLRDKTQGNLSKEEGDLLHTLVADLQMKLLEASK